MQKELKIKTKDGHFVYGDLVKSKKGSSKLVIFCHGFTGNRNEHIHFNGAKFFGEKGYDTFRFDFYNDNKYARHFEETSISQHGDDITTVLGHFQKQYKSIYLIGHSFGGTSLLFSNMSLVKAIVLWDAPYVKSEDEKKFFTKYKIGKEYYIDWGMKIRIGEKFIKQLFDFPDCGELIKKIHIPVKFIGTGTGKDSKKYFVKANKPKLLINLDFADHNFNSHEAEKKLFEETYDWIRKY
jgi:pimeloyl-ACP methyl ester carboxylesterase